MAEIPVSNAPVKTSSERAFGLVFAAVFAIIGSLVWRHDPDRIPTLWPFAVSAVFLALALLWTAPLRPLNRLWQKVGDLLHRIVSLIVMGLLFFVVITPVGLLMRGLGRDLLALRLDRRAPSYWIDRRVEEPRTGSMKQQF